MGRTYDGLEGDLVEWIESQHVFFTATAPANGGHINCSPKGLDALRILDPRTVAYLDLTGSGAETIAHLRENSRIVLMFCAFQGPPKILRLHGHGSVYPAGAPPFEKLIEHFLPLEDAMLASARSIICIALDRISDSCGYGVPLMRYEGDRSQLPAWTENRIRRHGPNAIREYQVEKNAESVDGLPALRPGADGSSGFSQVALDD